MKGLAVISLVLVLVLTSLSAYLRLAHSGIGCGDWPACYGQIGTPPASAVPLKAEDAYRKLVGESRRTLSWATPLHRLVASVLGLLVLGLFVQALRHRRHRLISAALLALTVFLAVLGIRSGALHDPAVVMGNLSGGFAMTGLLGWLVFSLGPRRHLSPRLATLTAVVIGALGLQILLGGLASANFAALACTDLPQCQGGWWPGPALATALDLSRSHEVNAGGQVVGGPEQVGIQRAHRLGAILAALLATAAAVAALRGGARFRAVAVAIVLLLTAEVAVGVTAATGDISMPLALSHNVLAALLLLALLKLLALTSGPRDRQAEAINLVNDEKE